MGRRKPAPVVPPPKTQVVERKTIQLGEFPFETRGRLWERPPRGLHRTRARCLAHDALTFRSIRVFDDDIGACASLTRRPINSAAAPDGRTAAASLEQNDFVATNGPEIGLGLRRARRSKVSDRLAVLAELSVADLRLEWRQLFRADPPRLNRDIMTRAVAYRLQEIAYGGASKATQRRLMTLAAEFETRGTIAPPSGPKIKVGRFSPRSTMMEPIPGARWIARRCSGCWTTFALARLTSSFTRSTG